MDSSVLGYVVLAVIVLIIMNTDIFDNTTKQVVIKQKISNAKAFKKSGLTADEMSAMDDMFDK